MATSPATTILIVDDALEYLQAQAEILEHSLDCPREGLAGHSGSACTIVTASSGREALTLLGIEPDGEVGAMHAVDPDCVLMDLNMPGLDGVAATRAIRSHDAFAHLPVLILTTAEDEAAMLRAFNAGATDFLRKPVSEVELRARVANAIRAKHEHDRVEAHEAELSRSRAKYRALYETPLVGLFRCTMDGARLLAANTAFARIFGYATKEECLKRLTPREIYEDRNQLRAVAHALRDGGRAEFNDLKVRTLHGQMRDLTLSAYLAKDEAGEPCVEGAVADITVRRRAEAEARQTTARYVSLFEHSPISLWEEDFSEVKTALDGLRAQCAADYGAYFAAHPGEVTRLSALVRVLDVNETTLSLFKAREKEDVISPAGLLPFFSESSLEQFGKELAHLAKGNLAWQGETQHRNLDGGEIETMVHVNIPEENAETWSRVVVSIQDVTARKRMERALFRSEERFRAMIENIYDIFYQLDLTGRLTFISPSVERVTGYHRDELHGKRIDKLLLDGRTANAFRRRMLTDGFVDQFEIRVRRKDGSVAWFSTSAKAIADTGMITGVEGIARDVTELKEAAAKLKELATTDSLTGLVNRRHFLERAAKELERAKRYARPCAVIVMDADLFKSVNDNYGHDGGDEALMSLARTIGEILRDVDLFGRLGGEEFGILLPETDREQAAVVGERVRAAMAAQDIRMPCGTLIRLTVSLGVAVYDPAEGQPGPGSLNELMKDADMALYRAKEQGRNQVVLHGESAPA